MRGNTVAIFEFSSSGENNRRNVKYPVKRQSPSFITIDTFGVEMNIETSSLGKIKVIQSPGGIRIIAWDWIEYASKTRKAIDAEVKKYYQDQLVLIAQKQNALRQEAIKAQAILDEME